MRTEIKNFEECVPCIVRGKWQNISLKMFDRLFYNGKVNKETGEWRVIQP